MLMSVDAIIGCAVLVAALGLLVGLTLWCRRRIERIALSRSRSAREISKDFRGD